MEDQSTAAHSLHAAPSSPLTSYHHLHSQGVSCIQVCPGFCTKTGLVEKPKVILLKINTNEHQFYNLLASHTISRS